MGIELPLAGTGLALLIIGIVIGAGAMALGVFAAPHRSRIETARAIQAEADARIAETFILPPALIGQRMIDRTHRATALGIAAAIRTRARLVPPDGTATAEPRRSNGAPR